jgi:hypothetical protein
MLSPAVVMDEKVLKLHGAPNTTDMGVAPLSILFSPVIEGGLEPHARPSWLKPRDVKRSQAFFARHPEKLDYLRSERARMQE